MAGKRFVVTFKFTGNDKVYYLNYGNVCFVEDIYEAKFMTANIAHALVHSMTDVTVPEWVNYMLTDGLHVREGNKKYKNMPIPTVDNIAYGFSVKQVTFS